MGIPNAYEHCKLTARESSMRTSHFYEKSFISMKSFIHFYEIIEIISMRNDSGDIVITIQMPHQNISEL